MSAVSAVSATSPRTAVELPEQTPADPPPAAERSPFAPPLPGEDETPTSAFSTRELVDRLQAEEAATDGENAAEGAGRERSKASLRRSAGRRAAASSGPRFDLSRARTVVIGLAGVLVLLLAVGGIGYLISRPGSPIATTVSDKPLALPEKAGDYTREPNRPPSLSQHTDGRTTITAVYQRGGKGQFVVLASRPEKDATSALEAAKAVGIAIAPGGACGRIGTQTACAMMVGSTTALVGVTQVEQSKDELLVALRRVAEGMG